MARAVLHEDAALNGVCHIAIGVQQSHVGPDRGGGVAPSLGGLASPQDKQSQEQTFKLPTLKESTPVLEPGCNKSVQLSADLFQACFRNMFALHLLWPAADWCAAGFGCRFSNLHV